MAISALIYICSVDSDEAFNEEEKQNYRGEQAVPFLPATQC
jgi:hypothetical protein